MEPQVIIARRISRELKAGMLVNLGIGIPTLVANYIPEGLHVFFQSENGLIGTGPPPRRAWRIPRSRMQAADPSPPCPAPARSTARCRSALFAAAIST